MAKRGSKQLEKDQIEDSYCSVLITCGKPSKEGKMQVEMTFEGDSTLAGYLLIQGTQLFFDQETDFDGEELISSPIHLIK